MTLRLAFLFALLSTSSALAEPLALPSDGPARGGRLTQAPDGSVLLSWVEPRGKKKLELRYARLGLDGAWSEPQTVHRGAGWTASWADAPTVLQSEHGWFALWLTPTAKDSHGTALMVATSEDGRRWERPTRAHGDESDTEHGFASLLPGPDGVDLAWLDGRGYVEGSQQTSLRMRRLGAELGPERVVDERVCDCCPTAASTDGSILAWRDRIGGEIRDVSVGRRGDDFAPVRATHDEWEFAGCPVNGPALATNDGALLAWYTADGEPSVQAVLLSEGWPRTPVEIDAGTGVLGRVGAAAWKDGWIVVWAREVGEGRADVLARTVARSGEVGDVQVLGQAPAKRTAGFPTVANLGGDVVIVWQDGEPAGLVGVRLSPEGARP